jgi:phosphohistidine phosphatase SixA
MRKCGALTVILFVVLLALAAASDPRQGQVLLVRHALAPGSGDPPGMRLDNCRTQRNLSAAGRRQAQAMGEALRAEGVRSARVFTSQWCRCRDTARLLGFGDPVEMEALNSFYEDPTNREVYVAALRSFLAGLPEDGEPVIWVTHYVTVQAMTGRAVTSGGGVWLRRGADGEWQPAGGFAAPDG